ncbi:MICOS complex subunit MIC60 isoform X3 [Salmo salar]|uniref:MICOS complex subunit MIC60 n=1 Tax=Salmo salar TaxID=8030 RepID=B5X1N7_SALSA|nr:MICOS complex subunit MIC60 isoform X3 [Salmo salar]ACI33218.1 Mitochondrial inner membrane protein [Salmo salar]
MLRVCLKGANSAARKCLCGNSVPLHPLQQCRSYTSGGSGSSAGKIVAASVLTVGGGVGGTILYANWDPKFRANVEKSIPYSDQVFGLALGPAAPPPVINKPRKVEPVQISSMSEVWKDSKQPKAKEVEKKAEQPDAEGPPAPAPQETLEAKCTECEHEPAVKERPEGEVAARLAEQDKAEQDLLTSLSSNLEDALGSTAKVTLQAIGAQEAALQAIAQHTRQLREAMEAEAPPDKKSTQWRVLEDALSERSRSVDEAGAAVLKAKAELDKLRGVIDGAKHLKIAAARPSILAAEENLHSMVVDLDSVVTRVQTAQSEAKIVSQYSELVNEAKAQFQKELNSITPEIQANWKGLTGKLTQDDLNSLIAHAHRRIDQLNRELAEQRVREQIHIDSALEQQKLEDKKALEVAVSTALEHNREQMRLEQEKKVEETREVMEAEMRTQLRRQAAAHTDHLRDVLKVQEQELRAEAEEILNSSLMEKETEYRRLTQDQLDSFTLDMNAAYARLKGMEEAIDSHVIAEEEARKAHQLWLSVEALNYTLKTAALNDPTEPLEGAVQAIKESCAEDEFAQALATALPSESLSRGVYSEASLRARFYAIRQLARRVALIDETRNSLYQYFLSYLQATLLFEKAQEAPPAKLSAEDLDTFKLLSYAAYSLEHGDLELAAKLVNQLKGESRRVAQDWLKEARLTLETKQVVSLLSAYANAVGLGTTMVP